MQPTEKPGTDYTMQVGVLTGRDVAGAVPQRIDAAAMPDSLTIRFRARRAVENCALAVYAGETRLVQRRRRIVTPGQMEEITVKKTELAGVTDSIRIEIEENI